MRKVSFLFISMLCLSANVNAQSWQPVFDSIFNDWNEEEAGVCAAIFSDDQLVFKDCKGMADVGQNRSLTTASLFHAGELGIAFNVYAILLLEENGRLNLDDKIHKYIPDLPEWGSRLSISNLLSHSSGLVDYQHIKSLKENQASIGFSYEAAIAVVKNQQSLCFNPGSEIGLSYSNLVMLPEIIAAASEVSYESYMLDYVFSPLGLKNAMVNMKGLPISKDIALPHNQQELMLFHGDFYCASGIYLSLEDFINWYKALEDETKISESISRKLAEVIVLPNGKMDNGPWGKLNYAHTYLHKERGVEVSWHPFNAGAYTGCAIEFLDHGFRAIVLGNDRAPYNGYIGMNTAYELLEDQFLEPETTDYDNMKRATINLKREEVLLGDYFAEGRGALRSITKREGKLYFGYGERWLELFPISEDRFQLMLESDDKIYIELNTHEDEPCLVYQSGEANPIIFNKTLPSQMKTGLYKGIYLNSEYGIAINVIEKDDIIFIDRFSDSKINLIPVSKMGYTSHIRGFQDIKFRMNNEGKPVIKLSFRGSQYVEFTKMDSI